MRNVTGGREFAAGEDVPRSLWSFMIAGTGADRADLALKANSFKPSLDLTEAYLYIDCHEDGFNNHTGRGEQTASFKSTLRDIVIPSTPHLVTTLI